MSREAVVATQSLAADSVALDPYAQLITDILECQDMLTYWRGREAQLKAALGAIMGNVHNGTLNGEPAVVYAPVNRFNATEFKRVLPNMARVYTHPVTKEELDVEMIKKARPDLYAQFQVRPMRIVYEPTGGPAKDAVQ